MASQIGPPSSRSPAQAPSCSGSGEDRRQRVTPSLPPRVTQCRTPRPFCRGGASPGLRGRQWARPFAGRATAVGQLLGRGGLFRPRRASQASVTLTASSWSCCFCFAPSLPVVLTQHPEGWRQGRSRPGSRPSRTPARGPRPWGVMLRVTAFGSSCRPDCLLPQCLPRNVSSYLATCYS